MLGEIKKKYKIEDYQQICAYLELQSNQIGNTKLDQAALSETKGKLPFVESEIVSQLMTSLLDEGLKFKAQKSYPEAEKTLNTFLLLYKTNNGTDVTGLGKCYAALQEIHEELRKSTFLSKDLPEQEKQRNLREKYFDLLLQLALENRTTINAEFVVKAIAQHISVLQSKEGALSVHRCNVRVQQFFENWQPENHALLTKYFDASMWPTTRVILQQVDSSALLCLEDSKIFMDKFKIGEPAFRLSVLKLDADKIYAFLWKHFDDPDANTLRERAIQDFYELINIAASMPTKLKPQELANYLNLTDSLLTDFEPIQTYHGDPNKAFALASRSLMEDRSVILYGHSLVQTCYMMNPKSITPQMKAYVIKSANELIRQLEKSKTILDKQEKNKVFYGVKPPRTSCILLLAKYLDDKCGDRLAKALLDAFPLVGEDLCFRFAMRLQKLADVNTQYLNLKVSSYYIETSKKFFQIIPQSSAQGWGLARVHWSIAKLKEAEGKLNEAKESRLQALSILSTQSLDPFGHFTQAVYQFEYALFLFERLHQPAEAKQYLEIARKSENQLDEKSYGDSKILLQKKILLLTNKLEKL